MENSIEYKGRNIGSKPLHAMFEAIPRHYDLVNRVITFGLDKQWRRRAAQTCLVSRPRRVLDLCCGTGDLAIDLARSAESGTEVTGADYSKSMLELAKTKAGQMVPDKKISFVCGEAARLPFDDSYFECIGVSFAFRNLTYQNPFAQNHLGEILRVLNDGGRCVIVETSQPRSRVIRSLYHLYLRYYVYPLGRLLSGNKGAYRYLSESARRYYSAQELKELLLTSGFREVSFMPLCFGAVGIYVAVK
ncbi:MAG: ubiquinone/menaquinone biosynthesis methyltransferase [Chloroflexi bacterium]|nr:ubiquinone/menaquinone biosynthesis methyltransferase [Chloroflexota bacterium]